MSSKAYTLKCRSCLRISEKLIPLDKPYNALARDKSEFVDAQITIATVMMTCANVQVATHDGLPQKVCTKCAICIREAFNFRRMCEQADIDLRKILPILLASASIESHKIDEGYDAPKLNCTNDQQRETIEKDNQEAEVVVEPSAEIWLDASSPCNFVQEIEAKLDDVIPPKIVDPPNEATIFDAPLPHNFGADITRDEPENADGSDGSFEQYEMWENKQKAKRKKVLSEKLKRIKSNKSNGKRKEKSVQKFMCEICSKVVTDIQAHSFVHKAERNYECDICKRKYKMKGSLTEHMQFHIDGEKVYNHLCPICGNKYRTSSKLTEHMRLHSDEKPFKCEHCGKAWKTKHKLKSHSRSHLSIKPHICSVCGKGFSLQHNWKYHMMMHAGDRPHKCDICGASFPRSSTLKIHMRGHTGVHPYQCQFCGEYFRESRQLTKHREICGQVHPE